MKKKAKIGTTPASATPKNDVPSDEMRGNNGVDLARLVKSLFLNGEPVLFNVVERYFAIRPSSGIAFRLGSEVRYIEIKIGSFPRAIIFYFCMLVEIVLVIGYSILALLALLVVLYAALKLVGLSDAILNYLSKII